MSQSAIKSERKTSSHHLRSHGVSERSSEFAPARPRSTPPPPPLAAFEKRPKSSPPPLPLPAALPSNDDYPGLELMQSPLYASSLSAAPASRPLWPWLAGACAISGMLVSIGYVVARIDTHVPTVRSLPVVQLQSKRMPASAPARVVVPPPKAAGTDEQSAVVQAAKPAPTGAHENKHRVRMAPSQTELSEPPVPIETQVAPVREPAPATSEQAEALPVQPTRGDVQHAIEAVRPALEHCAVAQHGTLFADLTIAPTGHVTYARLEGSFAGTPDAACMLRALHEPSLPRFSGPAFKVRYPFAL